MHKPKLFKLEMRVLLLRGEVYACNLSEHCRTTLEELPESAFVFLHSDPDLA